MKKKIYIFFAAGKYPGAAFAMAEDGTVLASHYCRWDWEIPNNLTRNEAYEKHYPGNYEVEHFPIGNFEKHTLLQAAIQLNEKHFENEKRSE